MFGIFVGLDIGTDSIKACCARRSLGGVRIVRRFHEALPSPETSEEERRSAAVEKVREILENCAAGPVPVASAVSAGAAFLRGLDLPIKKIQKLRDVVPFEMEAHLPLPVEETVIDFLVREGKGREGSKVLAAAVPTAELERRLDLLSRAGADPAFLDLDLLAASFPFTRKRAARETRTRILVDLGASKTSFLVASGGRVLSMRSLPAGGAHLTGAIAAEKGFSFQEAEEFKKAELPADFRLWPRAVVSHFEYLRREAEKTLLVSRPGGEPDLWPREEIVLCGGGARTRGLKEYLATHLACRVSTWRFPRASLFPGRGGDEGEVETEESLFAASGGLVWQGLVGGRPALNFRRGGFALPEPRARKKIHVAWTAAGVALLVAVGAGDLWWRIELESRRLESLRRQVEQMVRETVPGAGRVVDPVAQMRQSVSRDQEKLKGVLSLDHSATGAMGFLRELSERIQPQIPWTASDLSFSGDEISLSGEAASFDGVEEIRRALERSPYFSAVRATNVKGGAGKDRVEASFVLVLKGRDGDRKAAGEQVRRATR